VTHDNAAAPDGESVVPTNPIETRVRVFDRDELRWQLREAEYALADRRTGRFLIFESESVVRRLRNYPANWFEWSDDDLHSLSNARVT
jgi:hypothetical protein